MNRLFQVAKKDLTLLWKDKGALVYMLVVPLVLMAILGSIFKVDSSTESFSVPLAVVNQDGAASKQFTDVLSSTKVLKLEFVADEAAAKQRLSEVSNSVPAYIVIPAGYGAALEGQGQAQLVVVKTPGNDARAAAAESIVRDVVNSYNAVGTSRAAAVAAYKQAMPNATADQLQAVGQAAGSQAQESLRKPTASISAQEQKQDGPTPSGFDVVVPGYALMFALFAITNGAGSLLEEKEAGTFKRLLLTPLRPWALIGGKMFAQYVIGVTQVALLLLIGTIGFGAHAGNLLGLVLLTLAVPFAATGLAMLLVSLVRSRRQLASIATLVVLGSSALGGAWFPLWLLPNWMQGISRVTLTSWAMEGFNKIMIFGKGVGDILPNVAVLIVYGLVCYLIATRLFRARSEEIAA